MPPRASFLFAPGAGAPSTSAWMVAWRERLQALGPVETFDYTYMREGRKRPDRLPALIEAHGRALSTLRGRAGGPIFLAGKSMGGRIGCHLALEQPVAGVICFGFPLLSTSGRRRDEVLLALRTPILLVQGTRDPLCPLDLLAEVRPRMTAPNTLLIVEGGDHSLAVAAAHRKASGQTQADADARVLEAVQSFVDGILVAQSRA
jgi:predicted alpha/beta-hydrolase family hydrolase